MDLVPELCPGLPRIQRGKKDREHESDWLISARPAMHVMLMMTSKIVRTEKFKNGNIVSKQSLCQPQLCCFASTPTGKGSNAACAWWVKEGKAGSRRQNLGVTHCRCRDLKTPMLFARPSMHFIYNVLLSKPVKPGQQTGSGCGRQLFPCCRFGFANRSRVPGHGFWELPWKTAARGKHGCPWSSPARCRH